MSEPSEPFDGLLINGYGIYDRADQKRLRNYISSQIADALDDYLQSYMGREDATIFTDREVVEELIETINYLRDSMRKGWTWQIYIVLG